MMIPFNCEYTKITLQETVEPFERRESETRIGRVFRSFVCRFFRQEAFSDRSIRISSYELEEISIEPLQLANPLQTWENWRPDLSVLELKGFPDMPICFSDGAYRLPASTFHSLLTHSKYLQELFDGSLIQEEAFLNLSSYSKKAFFDAINLLETKTITYSNIQGAFLLDFLMIDENVAFEVDPSFFKKRRPRGAGELKSIRLSVKIDLSNQGISRINALRYFPNTFSLNLARNKKIKDFTPIAGLYELKELNLEKTSICNLSLLNGLLSLKDLNLYDCIEIEFIAPLLNLRSVESIDLRKIMIEDLRSLSEFSCQVRATIHFLQRNSQDALALLEKENIELEVLSIEDFIGRHWMNSSF